MGNLFGENNWMKILVLGDLGDIGPKVRILESGRRRLSGDLLVIAVLIEPSNCCRCGKHLIEHVFFFPDQGRSISMLDQNTCIEHAPLNSWD